MPSRKTTVNLLIALLLSVVWAVFSSRFTIEAGDFPSFYAAALMARQGNLAYLHDESAFATVERPLTPTKQVTVFCARPSVYAAALTPFAFLSLRPSFIAWIVWQAAMLVGCWFWAYRRFGSDAVALAALFPPAIMGFAFGQDPVVFLTLFVLSFLLFERNRLFASGLVMGLVFIKPHLMLLLPLALLLQRRWRMLFAMCASATLLAAASLALGGFAGAARYLDFLRHEHSYLSPTPWRMMNVYAIALNLGLDNRILNIALALFVVACVCVVCRQGAWWQSLSAAMIGTFLIAPHAYLYDSTLLVLPAMLIVFQARSIFVRCTAAAILTPIPSLLQLAEIPWTGVAATLLLVLLLGLAGETSGVFRRAASPVPQPA